MGPPNQPLHPDVLPFGRLWYGEPDASSNAVDYDPQTIHNFILPAR
jgi:hypothetical protein